MTELLLLRGEPVRACAIITKTWRAITKNTITYQVPGIHYLHLRTPSKKYSPIENHEVVYHSSAAITIVQLKTFNDNVLIKT